jgi:hypothetical protein
VPLIFIAIPADNGQKRTGLAAPWRRLPGLLFLQTRGLEPRGAGKLKNGIERKGASGRAVAA